MGNSPSRNDLTSNSNPPQNQSGSDQNSSSSLQVAQEDSDPLPIPHYHYTINNDNDNDNNNNNLININDLSNNINNLNINNIKNNNNNNNNNINSVPIESSNSSDDSIFTSTTSSYINNKQQPFSSASSLITNKNFNSIKDNNLNNLDNLSSPSTSPSSNLSNDLPFKLDLPNTTTTTNISTHTTPQKQSHSPSSSKHKSNKIKINIDIDSIIEKLVSTGLSKKYYKTLPISNDELKFISAKSRKIFMNQPMLLELAAPVKIVGDIHGQFNDLLRIFKLCGFPPNSNYLFLGDYVDRGKQSLETLILLLCLKIKYPENFFLLRGNHESAEITKMYGFYDECKRRTINGVKTWKMFVDVFNTLPVAATIADKIFCVHGGLSPDLKDLNQIKKIQRPTDIPDEGLLADLLWSDPQDKNDESTKGPLSISPPSNENSNSKSTSTSSSKHISNSKSKSNSDWKPNDRGVSYCFNDKVIKRFCSRFNFDLIARGHMVVEDGYEFYSNRKLVTIFSAPNYCGEFKNWGAVMNVNKKLMCSFELLKPKESRK